MIHMINFDFLWLRNGRHGISYPSIIIIGLETWLRFLYINIILENVVEYLGENMSYKHLSFCRNLSEICPLQNSTVSHNRC